MERISIHLGPGETLREGEYTVRAGADVSSVPAADRCPYCGDTMREFRTKGALRVARTDKPDQVGGTVTVGVFPMPAGLRLLKCDACVQFFSTYQEAA